MSNSPERSGGTANPRLHHFPFFATNKSIELQPHSRLAAFRLDLFAKLLGFARFGELIARRLTGEKHSNYYHAWTCSISPVSNLRE
jgi:hypothetical protein